MTQTCSVEGCNNPYHAKGYCRKHYTEFCKRDKSKYIPPKTPNEIIVEGDTARIILCNRQGSRIAETIIDAKDVEQIQKHRWYMHGKGYVQAQDVGMLHRFLLDPKEGEIIDHINKDKLNNQRSNLRIATLSENGYNSKIPATNTSGVVGVSYNKQFRKWEASLGTDGSANRRSFTSFDDAVSYRKLLENSEPTYFNHTST